MKIGVYFRVIGLVQGVGFRMATQTVASRHRITGWVRNHKDGSSVEIRAFGHPDDVDFFRAWLYDGPDSAVVKQAKSKPIMFETHPRFTITQ